MVYGKTRVLTALISHQTRNEDNTGWEILICGIILIMLCFVILLLCDRFHRIFCCPTIQEEEAWQETTEYIKISISS
jgi:hypothetical protein